MPEDKQEQREEQQMKAIASKFVRKVLKALAIFAEENHISITYDVRDGQTFI